MCTAWALSERTRLLHCTEPFFLGPGPVLPVLRERPPERVCVIEAPSLRDPRARFYLQELCLCSSTDLGGYCPPVGLHRRVYLLEEPCGVPYRDYQFSLDSPSSETFYPPYIRVGEQMFGKKSKKPPGSPPKQRWQRSSASFQTRPDPHFKGK